MIAAVTLLEMLKHEVRPRRLTEHAGQGVARWTRGSRTCRWTPPRPSSHGWWRPRSCRSQSVA